MNPTSDQFSKRFATVRFIMGGEFQQHFVERGWKPETAARIITDARRRFKAKKLDVVLDPNSVKWIGTPGAYTGLSIMARIDGVQQQIVMDTALPARRMSGVA
jgi:hypothetical protein